MLQMIASRRGVGAPPRWLTEGQPKRFKVSPVKLGRQGMAKQIYLGYRETDADSDFLKPFVQLARK